MPDNSVGRQADHEEAKIWAIHARASAWQQGRNDEIRYDTAAEEQAQAQAQILNLKPTAPMGDPPLPDQSPNPVTDGGQQEHTEHRVQGAVVALNPSSTSDV